MTTLWTKQVIALAESFEIPQWGKSFAIDFDKLGATLKEALQLPSCEIKTLSAEWIEHTTLNGTPYLFAIGLSPIHGSAFLEISKEDAKKWMQSFLNGSKGIGSDRLEEGFATYLLLQSMQTIDKEGFFPGCGLNLLNKEALPEGPSFCIQLSIILSSKPFFARLLLPKTFHNSFKEHFQKMPSDPASYNNISLPLSCAIGSTTLQLQEWKSLEIGDFLILDRCSYDMSSKKGSLQLMVKDKILAHALIKASGLKIVDFQDFAEDMVMLEDEDTFISEEEELAEEPKVTPTETLASIIKIPLTVHVEAARFSMDVEKLLQLTAGNIIELDIKPEQGVNLILQGKCIAKGELVKVGDVIGVKILEMGEV